MGFLAALAAQLIETFLSWIGKLLYREIKQQEQIKDDNARAAENLKKVKDAPQSEKNHKREDLLNG